MSHEPRFPVDAIDRAPQKFGDRSDWEPVLERFEQAWQAGSTPDIECFLPPSGAAPDHVTHAAWCELLVELVKIDIEYRWRSKSDRFRIEEYVARFSMLGQINERSHATDPLLHLIGEEYRVRQQWGDRPGHSEFLARFPDQGDLPRAELERIDAELAAEAAGRVPECERDTPPESPRATEPRRFDTKATLTLPGFEILATLGRGGMGVVYQARQLSLGRIVAIKMILAGEHASPHERGRFRAEAESAARLQHPNIVSVHEVGEHDGQPFCVFEFMKGGSLAERLAESPLAPPDAAPLVSTLARAVQFAHEHGIIHRDLKPSNIMLQMNLTEGNEENEEDAKASRPRVPHATAAPTPSLSSFPSVRSLIPKITDFGLAKRLDADGPHTQTGAMLGTPSYMAPEQALGESRAVGPATDVYALGAILYESLVGRPPFRAATTLETLDQVRSQEPVAPSRLMPQVPRDLETFCVKCLEKSPERRYASAAELADDLDRYLTHQPIRARRAGPVERAIKWSRRRPTTAAVAAVGLIAALCLVTGGMIYNARLQEAARRADRQKLRADENFTRAFDAVNRMFDRVGFERLADVPEMEEVRRELVGEAIEFYNGLLANQDNPTPAARREYAGAYLRLGQIDHLLGRLDQAEQHVTRSLALHRELAAEFPAELKHRNDVALAHFHLGLVRAAANRRPEAEPEYVEAITIWNTIEGEFPECRGSLANACNNLARLFGETRRPDRAAEFYNEALARIDSLARDQPDNTQWQNDRASVRYNLGLLHANTGRPADAEEFYRQAIAIWEPLAERNPRQSELQARLAECYTSFAFLCTGPRAGEGDELLQKALARRAELAGRFPKVPNYQDHVARTHHNIGSHYQLTGRGNLAEQPLREAIAIRERLVVEYPEPGYEQTLAESYNNLAMLLHYSGRAAEARKLFEQAIPIQEQLDREHPEVSRFADSLAASLINYGNLRRDSGQLDAALDALNRAVDHLHDVLRQEPDHDDAKSHLFSASGARAQTLAALGRHADSIADWDRVIELADAPTRADYEIMRALARIRAGDPARAAAEADAIATAEDVSQDLLYNTACVYSLAAAATERDEILSSAQRRESSERLVQRAAAILNRLNDAGYFHDEARRNNLRADPDLEAVRSTRTWPDLLGQLEAK